jgi:hypothetical protein
MIFVDKSDGEKKSFHLISDSDIEQLHEFAKKKLKMDVKLRKKYFKYPCYILLPVRRKLAIMQGAVIADNVKFFFALDRFKLNKEAEKLASKFKKDFEQTVFIDRKKAGSLLKLLRKKKNGTDNK